MHRKKNFKQYIFLILSLICLVISSVFLLINTYKIHKKEQESIYLNEIIEHQNNRPNVNTYLDLYAIETYLAKSTLNPDVSIYLVSDDAHYYLATLNTALYNKIKEYDFNKGPYRIYGKSISVDNTLKNIIMNAYSTSTGETLTDKEFIKLYGGVYIDTSFKITPSFPFITISIILGIIGIIFLIIFLITKLLNKKKISQTSVVINKK